MVNKQYNLQNISKNKTKHLNAIDAKTLKQSITVIPNVNSSIGLNDSYHLQNAFERNIVNQLYHSLSDSLDGDFDNKHTTGDNSMDDTVKTNSITGAADTDTQSQNHLSINDIGRFQYILQMDREMVRFPLRKNVQNEFFLTKNKNKN